MNEPLALPTIALRAPRKFACHTLPDTPLEPPLGDAGRRLARAVASALGLPAGANLSYADGATITAALSGRTEVK